MTRMIEKKIISTKTARRVHADRILRTEGKWLIIEVEEKVITRNDLLKRAYMDSIMGLDPSKITMTKITGK